ncbi:uncharacterized protein LOC118205294 [Stegodyphus dumicola]|uniref:uncharacterized protein LOC118205294 n=1 Tax=Stegodyphus dumicola TaxID=202533 RepID=UPI0015AE57B6|nr:uncharacterized protein LOC118205294 [Stegodyphus dumicola]
MQAVRQANLRARETEEENRSRLDRIAHRESILRTQESEQDATIRRMRDAARHRQVRSEETLSVREDRLRMNAAQRSRSTLHNAGRCGLEVYAEQHSVGSMEGSCDLCNGLFFTGERNARGRYMHCCNNGKIVEAERRYPEEWRNLMNGNHPFSEEFYANIRTYNCLLSFASMGANIEMPTGSGPYCFRIHGAIYHRTSHLHPPHAGQEQYAQLYILDSDQALRQRMNIFGNVALNAELLRQLDAVLRNVNPYAEAYKMLKEFEEETLREQGAETAADIRMYIKGESVGTGEHRGRYNAPKENEVAVVFKSTDGAPPSNRDIVIHPRGGGLINISTLNPNLEPMTYVLFFPHGDQGFRVGQQYTELQFYSHRVSVRRDCYNPILYGRKLFQQYLVDAYVKVGRR